MVMTHFPGPLLPSSSVSNLNMYRALTHAPDAFPGAFPSAVLTYCFVCHGALRGETKGDVMCTEPPCDPKPRTGD